MTTPDQSRDAITLALHHAYKDTSAMFCLRDALMCFRRGWYRAAHRWALGSLSYSVGIFHDDYRSVNR